MTVLQVEDELFPECPYRLRERLRREFLVRLKQAGGCEGAKKAGMPDRLRARYDDLMEKLERLPWHRWRLAQEIEIILATCLRESPSCQPAGSNLEDHNEATDWLYPD